MKTLIKLRNSALLLGAAIALWASAAYAQTAPAEMSPEARAYLTQALDIMEKNSLLKKQVNWDDLRRQTFAKAAGARETIDTWDAIRFALKAIGDNHSFLQLSKELRVKEDARRKTADTKATEAKSVWPSPFVMRRRPEVVVHRAGECTVGQIVVPLYTKQQGDDFATLLNKFIAEADAENLCGWIVDLRGNGGGNVFPMLAGVGALLDEGDASYALDADGGKTAFFYKNGQSGLREPDGKETVVTEITGGAYRVRRQVPVAVLIDKTTASSGEGIAIAFRPRKETRFFGTPTYGVSTSTEGFLLSDGANIVLTTGVGMDTNGTKYFSGIAPDETIPSAEKAPAAPAEDAQLQAALRWLVKRKR